jgi:hypothetical protein
MPSVAGADVKPARLLARIDRFIHGFFRDPLTTHGITDAPRDAEFLARAVVAGGKRAIREDYRRPAMRWPGKCSPSPTKSHPSVGTSRVPDFEPSIANAC